MPTPTSNYGLEKPLVNDPTDQDLWGVYLNDDMDDIDGLLATAIKFPPSVESADFFVTAPTSGSTNTGDSKKLFRCDATTAAMAANLPSAVSAGAGFTVAFKKTDASAHAVTLTPAGSDKIDGAATFALSAQYNWAILVCDGISEWDILSDTPITTGLALLAADQTFTGINTFTNKIDASAAEVDVATQVATDHSSKAASTSFANPGGLVASAGTGQLPNGFIIKGGVDNNTANPRTVTFATPFPTACIAVTANPTDNNIGIERVSGFTTTGFTLTQGNASGHISYIAVGY